MSTNKKAIGLLLFSGIVIIVSSRRLGIFDIGGWMFNRDKEKSKRTGSTGDFIIAGKTQKFLSGEWRSIKSTSRGEEAGEVCELELVNDMGDTVIFCWVDFEGRLCHYYPVNDCSIRDGSVSNRHEESTVTHHAFVCIKQSADQYPKSLSDIPEEQFIFVYRPTMAGFKHTITLSRSGLRGAECRAHIACTKLKPPSAVIDTSNKEYLVHKICDFICRCESDVFEAVPGLRDTLTADLLMLNKLLPPAACKKLQQSTPIWLNKSITFGTVDAPVVGDTCCFHPKGGEDWLRQNGMRVDKAGGIEIYCAEEYMESRSQWGTGGLLLHEFCHAYHNKFCEDGYDCEDIRNAYTTAMNKKLYDSVMVHGRQGLRGPQKAYACANCMEFFAELSVAFLYRLDEDTEYNKWYPYNYALLRRHDPDTCHVLSAMWGLPVDTHIGSSSSSVSSSSSLLRGRAEAAASTSSGQPAVGGGGGGVGDEDRSISRAPKRKLQASDAASAAGGGGSGSGSGSRNTKERARQEEEEEMVIPSSFMTADDMFFGLS